MTGRPTDRTPEACDKALEGLRDGRTLAEIAEEMGLKRTTLLAWLHVTPELSDAYARAREEGLHARAERLVAKSATPLPTLASGGIDPAAVTQLKLEIDTEKWTLAKLVPYVYGDKQQIEHSGSISLADKLREARERRRGEG